MDGLYLVGAAGRAARGFPRHYDFAQGSCDTFFECFAIKPAGRARVLTRCKGVVGDWRSLFSAEQARRLAAKMREHTAGTGIERPWPELADALKLASIAPGANHDEQNHGP